MEKNKIGERLQEVRKKLFNVSREKFAEKMGLAGHQIRDIETGRTTIPGPLVKLLQAQQGISPTWLLTGEGPMKIGTTHQAAGDIIGPGAKVTAEATIEINVHEGVMMTTKVLSSKTGYANALWHNLKSFESAVDREGEMSELADEVRRLSKTVDSLREELRAVVTPGSEVKKREVNGET